MGDFNIIGRVRQINREKAYSSSWNYNLPQSRRFRAGYVAFEDYIKNVRNDFVNYSISYTKSYVGKKTERGFVIRMTGTTTTGAYVETFYEISTSIQKGTRWKSLSNLTNGFYAIKNAQLIGKLGEHRFWTLLEKDRKITLSIPTEEMAVAKTFKLALHDDARIMRLEYNGNGNGLDIITKVNHPPPPPPWMWMIFELKTVAVNSKDIKGYDNIKRYLGKAQKGGLTHVKKHVENAIKNYSTGNPYKLSKTDFNDLLELRKEINKEIKINEKINNILSKDPNAKIDMKHTVAGLMITQGLKNDFTYAKNIKYDQGMRLASGWFGGYTEFSDLIQKI